MRTAPARRSWREPLDAAAGRAVLALPRPVLGRLAGPPVVIDGQRLDVEMQLLLRLRRVARDPDVGELPIPRGRRAMERQCRTAGGRQPIGEISPVSWPGPAGETRGRLYTPRRLLGEQEPGALLVYFHGGAWIYGSLDSHDPVCRFLAERAGVRVLAVDYRRAPEHPFPAAVDDAQAAYAWVARSASHLGADPARIAVGGDSAGGCLAAVVAAGAAEAGRPPAFSLLIYPSTRVHARSRSAELFDEGFYLTRRLITLGSESYLQAGASPDDVRVSPLLRPDLSGGCPTYVATAGFDPLRDEGEQYARRLQEAGVEVQLRRFEGLIHGFANMVGLGRSAPAAMEEVAAALRAGLAANPRE